jgi:hypothetical protein
VPRESGLEGRRRYPRTPTSFIPLSSSIPIFSSPSPRLRPPSEIHLLVRARDCRSSSAAEPPSLPAWRLASVRYPYCKAFDTAGRLRCLRVSDSRIFGAILKQDTGSVNKAGLAVHDLAGAAAATESGLLFATDAKARAGGFPLPLHLACFVARG